MLSIAVLFSVTLGFWFAIFSTYAAYYFTTSKIKSIVFAILAIVILSFGQIMISKVSEAMDRISTAKIGAKKPEHTKPITITFETPTNITPKLRYLAIDPFRTMDVMNR